MRPKHSFKGQQKIKDAEKDAEKEQEQDAEEADEEANEEADEEPKQPNQLKQTNQLKPRQDETKQPEDNHSDTRRATPKEEEILRDSECLHLYILIVCIY